MTILLITYYLGSLVAYARSSCRFVCRWGTEAFSKYWYVITGPVHPRKVYWSTRSENIRMICPNGDATDISSLSPIRGEVNRSAWFCQSLIQGEKLGRELPLSTTDANRHLFNRNIIWYRYGARYGGWTRNICRPLASASRQCLCRSFMIYFHLLK